LIKITKNSFIYIFTIFINLITIKDQSKKNVISAMQAPTASPVYVPQEVWGQGGRGAKRSTLLPLLLFAALACVLSLPLSARAGETLQQDGKSGTVSAALTFAIVIPSVLRLLENTHPEVLPAFSPSDTLVSAQQRMVLISTLGKGFCMDLRQTQQQLTNWHITSSGSSAGIWIEATEGGYRLCARKAGRYEVLLQHNFEFTRNAVPTSTSSVRWPVNVSLTNP
jgi:hypothetical protein